MAAHRYWRIYVTKKGQDATYCNVREIELRASIGGADETSPATTVIHSSTQGAGMEGSNAFDDNSSTFWAFTAAAPQWVKVDFGAGNEKDIVQVALTSYVSYQMFMSWSLQYSDDDSAWTSIFSIEYDPIWNDNEQRAFSANDSPTINGNKTFWRINASLGSGGGNYIALSEIAMAIAFGGADQATGGKAYSEETYRYANRPSVAFDDNTGTFWANYGNALPTWIGYRWGSAKDIVQLTLTARNDSSYDQSPKDFALEYWDGSAYQIALTVTGATWGQGTTNVYYMPYGTEARASKLNGWAVTGAESTVNASWLGGYAIGAIPPDEIGAAALTAYAILDSSIVAARPHVFVAT